MQRKRIIFAVVAIALLLAALAYYLTHRSTPLAYSGTIETREINIGSKIGGRVTNVFVEEGQQVPANTPLVTFEADQYQAQRDQAQAAVLQAEADYNRLQRGNRPQEIAQADATLHENKALLDEALNGSRPEDIRQAQADYDAAKANAVDGASTYDRMVPLAAKDIISKQQFDSYTAQRNNTAQLAESARQHLAVLQAGTRIEDIEAARHRYEQALAADQLAHAGYRQQDITKGKGSLAQSQARVTELDAILREAHLVCPADATVETVSVRPGDPHPRQPNRPHPPRTLAALGQGLRPRNRPQPHPRRPVRQRHSRFPQQLRLQRPPLHRLHPGDQLLRRVPPRNVQTRDDSEHEVFGVKVHIDNPNNVLKSGMSATVTLP